MTALLALGAALALAPVSTAVPGRVQDLAPRADGSVDVATVDPTTGAQLSRLAPDGALGSPLALAPAGNLLDYAGQVDQPETQDLVEQVATLPTGGAVAVTWAGTHAAGGVTTVITSDAAGNVQPAVPVAGFDSTSQPTQLRTGPTGAVAILSDRLVNGDTSQRITFRPAGSQVFTSATRLGPTVDWLSAGSSFNGARSRIALGPDGGGAILVLPDGNQRGAAALRRISPAGEIGPPIPTGLPEPAAVAGRIAFTPNGTLAVVLAAYNGNLDHPSTRLYATSLTPGATRATRLRLLGEVSSDAASEDPDEAMLSFTLAVGAPARVLITAPLDSIGKAGRHTPGTAVLEGNAGGKAKRVLTLPIGVGRYASGVIAADGSASLVAVHRPGDDVTAKPAKGDRPTVLSLHQPAGGRFGSPRVVSPAADRAAKGYVVGTPVALPDGTAAVPYRRGDGPDEASFVVRFTP